MKKITTILTSLLVVLVIPLVGCAPSSPIQSDRHPRLVYEGILTNANLVTDGYTSTPGTVTLDNKTIVFGRFYDIKGQRLQELTLGIPCRILFKEQESITYYYIEQIKNK
jgi:hypothetical protein